MPIHTSLRSALFALLLASLAGCGASPDAAAKTPSEGAAAHAHAAGSDASADAGLPPGDPADYSIYQVESEWKDQAGRARRLDSLAGRVQVVAMVYTYCGYACPAIVGQMKRIETEFADRHPDGIGFVLVSIDPERDTPERLGGFAEGMKLDPARWTLLNGNDDAVLELAALLGIKYRRESATDFSHTNAIVVLDEHGIVRHQQLGLGADREKTIAVIRGLL